MTKKMVYISPFNIDLFEKSRNIMFRDSQIVALFLFWRWYSFCCPVLFIAKDKGWGSVLTELSHLFTSQ